MVAFGSVQTTGILMQMASSLLPLASAGPTSPHAFVCPKVEPLCAGGAGLASVNPPQRESKLARAGKTAETPLGDPSVKSTMVFKASGRPVFWICWYAISSAEMVLVLLPHVRAAMSVAILPRVVVGASRRVAVISNLTRPIRSYGLNKLTKLPAAATMAWQAVSPVTGSAAVFIELDTSRTSNSTRPRRGAVPGEGTFTGGS